MSPRIAFCTTCKGRAQHLKLTLPKNLIDNADYENAVFVILNYGSQDDLLEYLRMYHARDIESGRVAVYTYETDGPFKMAHAKNLAHRAGLRERADILVNLDADNFAGCGFARYLAHEFESYPHAFFLWARMQKGAMPRGINGRIAVTRNAFLKVGGYDERFMTWSPDDKDFNRRLRRCGYEAREIPTHFLDAVRHNDKMRFREYPHAKNISYAWAEVDSAVHVNRTLVNHEETAELRSAVKLLKELFIGHESERIEVILPALPTRIFGIGMHKTGTTSLHEALKILGFESAHWPSAHWAKAVFSQVRESGRSPSLDRYYAASDLPLPLLFKELDSAYPGSKFILTERDEDKWLKSVEAHFDSNKNRFRGQWDSDPFTHQVHRELYGRKSFDAATFLQRYRRHGAEVREHFKNRPADLLTLDTPTWNPLCQFLNVPVPKVPYPHANPLRGAHPLRGGAL